MHFEVLVEDISGKVALSALLPKIIAAHDTFTIHNYRGIGRIPKNLKATGEASHRILLDRLPQLIRGYGRSFQSDYKATLVVVCDLDDRCQKTFRRELLQLLAACSPAPRTQFCIAVEEGEAWLLGDVPAVCAAYPDAKSSVLQAYANDSICGTWERLADAIHKGGSAKLRAEGWQRAGLEKSNWAAAIAPKMNVEKNNSPSFCYLRDKLREHSRLGRSA
jgi:hypothetical protein